jgi:D-alanine transaminase
VTPSLESVPILAGVTRTLLLQAAPEVVSRAVTIEELHRASEAMLVGTTTMVTAITELDGKPVNGGKPGPVAMRMLKKLTGAIAADLGFRDVLEKLKGDTVPAWTTASA